MNHKRIAKLTTEEDKAWEFAFLFYLDSGYSDSEADRLAWRDLRKEFSRLRKYTGCS